MMLDIRDIHVLYGKSRVINGLSLSVEQGSRTALLGRNGVGKTTLMKAIMGVLPASAGSIQLMGKEISKLKTFKRSLAGIGYVPQGREIIPMLTVDENLELGALGHKIDNVREKKEWALSYFPMLNDHLHRNGGVLSGGLQQQLALARCLMTGPKIMLLDEPTEGIQPNVVAAIAETLKQIAADTGITILLVEQNLKFAKRVAERFVVMQKGAIVAEGSMSELDDEITRKYLSV